MPLLFGSILRRNTYILVLNKALQANELAMLSNIGDVSEDVHTYVLESWVDLAPGESPLFRSALTSFLKVEA